MIADDEEEANGVSKYKLIQKSEVSSCVDTSKAVLISPAPRIKNKPSSTSGCSTLCGHIILVGVMPENAMKAFLEPLRQLSSQQVVYLHDTLPSAVDAAVIEETEGAYFVQGSPLLVRDLQQAGAKGASKVVILADLTGHWFGSSRESDNRLPDHFGVFMVNVITQHFNCSWLVEFSVAQSMKYLVDRAHDLDPLLLWPRYTAGQVFLGGIFDSLLAQAYYNPQLVDIINMLAGGAKYTTADMIQEGNKLQLVDLPAAHIGNTYADLFKDLMLHHNMLPLGLLRGPDPKADNVLPFVLTNPNKELLLGSADRVYCLSPT